MKAFVTGGAGFIGSNLVDRLLIEGHSVKVYDNLSTGRMDNLLGAMDSTWFSMTEGDLHDLEHLRSAMEGSDIVFHFAANADVRHGPEHPVLDFDQNTIGTMNVLEAMRANRVKRIVFASSASVYGEPETPTPEDTPCYQTSLYGASKHAAEGFIEAYCEAFGMAATILRFVSVLGERYSHGHVIDFCQQLKEHPDRLDVLGDGNQRKSYIYVGDVVSAVIATMACSDPGARIYNVGNEDTITVRESVEVICEVTGCKPVIHYGTDPRGWIGDNPNILLDASRLRDLEWRPGVSIRGAIYKTVYWWQYENVR